MFGDRRVADALVAFAHGRALGETAASGAVAKAPSDRHFQSERLGRLRTVRRRSVRVGGGVSRRRSFGAGYRLAPLGFVTARPGHGPGREKHKNLPPEQTQSPGRKRDRTAQLGALTV